MRERRELAVSKKTAFAGESIDVFETDQKKSTAGAAERVSKETGVREIQKVEKADELCRRWYGVCCVQEANVCVSGCER